jgi:hypothetical protein
MSPVSEPKPAMLSILAVGVGIIALLGLLPMAWGLPSIASSTIPFADAIWFTANLVWPLLLICAGLRILFRSMMTFWFVVSYAILIIIAGGLTLWPPGFNRFTAGWLTMTLCVGVLLLILRRLSLWALIGAVGSSLLLGFLAYLGIFSYISAPESQFSTLLPMQLIGCVLSIAVAFQYRRLRRIELLGLPQHNV